MNEQEWLASGDPQRMLEWLQTRTGMVNGLQVFKPIISDRKMRLFACACCRAVWPLLTDPRSRRAVEVAEKYADGEANRGELVTAHKFAADAFKGAGPQRGSFEAELAMRCCAHISFLTENAGLPRWFGVSTKHAPAQAALLRCVVGNPFRPVTLPREPVDTGLGVQFGGMHERCPWLTPDVLALAGAGYEGRDFSGLGALADALEDAGCTDADLLGHLRGPGPHALGCWCVDLILGKA